MPSGISSGRSSGATNRWPKCKYRKRLVPETKRFVIAAGEQAQGFHDEIVVVALGQPRDGDCSDNAGRRDPDGEAAAVGRVFFLGQPVAFVELAAGLLEQTPDVVRAFVKTGDYTGFAGYPARIVGRGAGQGAEEERLIGVSEAANVDYERQVARDGEFAEQASELPCRLGAEGLERQGGLLNCELGDVFGECHTSTSVPQDGRWALDRGFSG